MADTFKILGQKQNVEINPAGNGFIDTWDVTYRVTSGPAAGTIATLSVPDSEHNADYVRKAILAKIADLAAIHALGG